MHTMLLEYDTYKCQLNPLAPQHISVNGEPQRELRQKLCEIKITMVESEAKYVQQQNPIVQTDPQALAPKRVRTGQQVRRYTSTVQYSTGQPATATATATGTATATATAAATATATATSGGPVLAER